jgi:hypothetical protein
MGFKGLMISLLLVGLFTISLISFSGNNTINNGGNESIFDDSEISSLNQSLRSNFNQFESDSGGSSQSFSNDTPKIGTESIQIGSITSIWKTMITAPKAVYQVTQNYIVGTLFDGVEFAVIFTTIIAILVVVIILYAWQLIRTGAFD